ncbi:MAG: hypothetical protein AAFV53_04170 [Myxococcota bacterium]
MTPTMTYTPTISERTWTSRHEATGGPVRFQQTRLITPTMAAMIVTSVAVSFVTTPWLTAAFFAFLVEG